MEVVFDLFLEANFAVRYLPFPVCLSVFLLPNRKHEGDCI